MRESSLEDDLSTTLPAVINAFRSALGVDPEELEITVDTDFFDAGGNSVRAARLVAQLRAAFDAPVSMQHVFTARTAGRVAAVCAGVPLEQLAGGQVSAGEPNSL